MTRGYILTSVLGVLQHQHQAMSIDYDMVQTLKELFVTQGRVGRQVAIKGLLNTSMSEVILGRQVSVHFVKKPSTSEPKGGKKWKKAWQNNPKSSRGMVPQGALKKPKGKCFKCNQLGHWKGDCPLKKVNKPGISQSLVTELFQWRYLLAPGA